MKSAHQLTEDMHSSRWRNKRLNVHNSSACTSEDDGEESVDEVEPLFMVPVFSLGESTLKSQMSSSPLSLSS